MITRSQMRRQLRAKGGIMNAVPRQKYGIGDFVRKLIPNELADIAVKAAPFVAPFNPGIAAAMRGIGRYDQRGDFKDALKQGALTYGFGKGIGKLGGASGSEMGNIFGRQKYSMEGFKDRGLGRLFKGADAPKVDPKIDPKIPGTPKTEGLDVVREASDKVFSKIPGGDKLPSMVKQKLLVGGITSGASALYSYFTDAFEPQQPGESMEEYIARRKTRVKQQMRGYMDSYYTPLRSPQYAAMSDEEKNNYIDSIVGQGMATGGRVGYQTGGITMANTLAENMRRNIANQQAVGGMFQAARNRLQNIPQKLFPEGNFQQIRANAPNQATYNIDATADLVRNNPFGVIGEVAAPALTAAASIPYDVIQGIGRAVDQSDVDTSPYGGIVDDTEIPTGPSLSDLGQAIDAENPLSSALERTIGAATPLAEKISGQDYSPNYLEAATPTPDAGLSQAGVVPGFTRLKNPDGAPGNYNEFMYRGPDGQIYGSETYSSIAAGQYPDIYDPNKKVIDEPMTDEEILAERELNPPTQPSFPSYNDPLPQDQLMAGFEEYKKTNPPGVGTTAMIPVKLPGGYDFAFSGSAEANAFRKYLESIGQAPYQKRAQPIESIGGGLSKLAGGGMPMGEPRVNQGGITELDFRAKGGFVPVGIKEKADDVPAMLSKNEFVFTADAVRGAGNGSVEKGAQKMYDTMKNLERRVT